MSELSNPKANNIRSPEPTKSEAAPLGFFGKLGRIFVPENCGFILIIAGGLIIFISFFLQMFSINNGTSGQLTVDSLINRNVYIIPTAIVIIILGYLLWVMFSKNDYKYASIFGLAFVSYFCSNLAVMFSLYQVQVSA